MRTGHVFLGAVLNVSEHCLRNAPISGHLKLASPFDVLLLVDLGPRIDSKSVVGLRWGCGRDVGAVEDHLSVDRPLDKVLAPLELIRVPSLGSIKAEVDGDGMLFVGVPDVHPANMAVQACDLNVDFRVLIGDQEERSDLAHHVGRNHVD